MGRRRDPEGWLKIERHFGSSSGDRTTFGGLRNPVTHDHCMPPGTSQRRRAREGAQERLLTEARHEESWLARIEATIAAVEEASAAGELDYEDKQQALSDLGVWIDIYPNWQPSNFRWVMAAFEQRENSSRW
jgi:hypothetical protein